MFTQSELSRYARHLNLPNWGIEGQERLKKGRVLVIGAGGLGCPVLQYLAAAGVGHIGIIDPDIVADSNLQRQVLYTTADIGRPKVVVAAERLTALNPWVVITPYQQAIDRSNALNIISLYDIIVDGTDNFSTRYLINDACILLNKPLVYAAIFRFEGQVSVFNLTTKNAERAVHYRDVYPTPPPPHLVPDCAQGGVLGVLPGIIGSIQANEVLKLLTGVGQPLAGRLFLIDTASFTTRILTLAPDPTVAPVTELIDYDQFCGTKTSFMASTISILTLKKWLDMEKDCCVLDVRTEVEFEAGHLPAIHLPLSILPQSLAILPKDKPIVVYCKSGSRSQTAVRLLHEAGFDNLLSLEGGLQAWATHIDPFLNVL